MKLDASVSELITKAYDAKMDVYIRFIPDDLKMLSSDGIRTLVLLPGAYYFGPESSFSAYGEKLSPSSFYTFPEVLFADVRYMVDSSFREFLTKKKYRRIVPVFAECAAMGEYGFREAYSWIGEYRAEITHFCQVVPVLSPSVGNPDAFCGFFGSEKPICIGEEREPPVSVYKTASSLSKFYHTACEAEKYAYRKILIYFNSRTEAAGFGSFLQKRGTAFILTDGSLTAEKYRSELKRFYDGDINILLTTKSFIPSSLFLRPDIVMICGAPFSVSHISRCQTVSAFSPVKIIYCEDDLERNRRIIRSFADVLSDENVYKEGTDRLSQIKKFLEN